MEKVRLVRFVRILYHKPEGQASSRQQSVRTAACRAGFAKNDRMACIQLLADPIIVIVQTLVGLVSRDTVPWFFVLLGDNQP